MHIKSLALAAAMLSLSGCTTYYGMWNEGTAKAPAAAPKIILGQTASLWSNYSKMDPVLAKAWKDTGMFKDVQIAATAVPPAQGTFIKTECESDITVQGGEGEFILVPLWFVTLGMMPIKLDFETHTCKTGFFQNGNNLSQTTARYTYKRMWSSWPASLMYSNDKIIDEGRTTAAANIVATQLVGLKKAYP